jgi:hypothetical protein
MNEREHPHTDKRVRKGKEIPLYMQRPMIPINPKAKTFKKK